MLCLSKSEFTVYLKQIHSHQLSNTTLKKTWFGLDNQTRMFKY